MNIPPFADAVIELSESQKSAIHAYELAGDDHESRSRILYHIQAWDRHLGRDCTLAMRDRLSRARRVWDGWVFQDGAGI